VKQGPKNHSVARFSHVWVVSAIKSMFSSKLIDT